MRHLLKARIVVLAALAYVAVAVVVPTPAPGLNLDTGGGGTLPVKIGANADVGTASTTITCPWSIGYPHKSSHVPGTANTKVKATCTQAVTRIELRAQLWYRDVSVPSIFASTPRMVADSGWSSGWNRRDWSTNAAATCIPGEYQARGWINVTFPPGYVPIIPSSSGQTDWKFVDCVLTGGETEHYPVAPF